MRLPMIIPFALPSGSPGHFAVQLLAKEADAIKLSLPYDASALFGSYAPLVTSVGAIVTSMPDPSSHQFNRVRYILNLLYKP